MLRKRNAQVTGRHIILMIIILLAVLLAMIVIIAQSKGTMTFYVDKIFS